jgi:hypothetical protein
MTSRKLILNNLLDLGGVGTLNNFYSRTARTHKGSLLYARKLFKSYLEDGLIEKIDTIGKPANKAREVFYCLTKKGAHYIGRESEYKYRKYGKSPNNVMHESMKFDVALSFLRQYPNAKFNIRYDASFYGVRPDILIRIESTNPAVRTRFLLCEIERKKTVDRVYHEKVARYEEMFRTIEQKRSHNVNQFMVLFVFTDIWFDIFLRPQEYGTPAVAHHIEHINYLVRNLVTQYCKNLPEHRYRFMPFHSFHRPHEPVWLTPSGNRVSL